MGHDKATLPFGDELMLQRVVRLLSSVIRPKHMVVVAAPNQPLPTLPQDIAIARDDQEYRGPLQGLATGLRAIGDRVDAVYATGCDVPLLVPTFVERMFQLLGDYDAAVPFDGQHYHPLAAAYRPRVLPHIQALLNADRLRAQLLFESITTRTVPFDNLREVDPQLTSLENLNHYAEYLKALATVGLIPSAETGDQADLTL